MKQNMAKILLCWKSCIFVLYIFRLFAVLVMPTSTTDEKQAKIRDLEALGRWYSNALFPNEGLGGVLKPDYVAFHHNGYYASAYTPHALHNAALIQYLLSGTAFEFSKTLLCASDEWKQEPMSPSFFEPFSWKRHDVWHVNCHYSSVIGCFSRGRSKGRLTPVLVHTNIEIQACWHQFGQN